MPSITPGNEVTVRTNNVPRDVIEAYELSLDERAEFDYLNWRAIDTGNDSATFFRFKGDLYDLGEFLRAPDSLPGWDGYQSDSFFSGVVVRYVEDFERVVVGTFYC